MANVPTNYAFLQSIKDRGTRDAVKAVLDRVAYLEKLSANIVTVAAPLASDLDTAGKRITNLPDPQHKADAVSLDFLQRYVESRFRITAPAPASIPTPPPAPAPDPPPGPSGLTCYTDLAVGQPAGIPAAPNLRWFRGDFCGPTVPGMPAVAGGASDPSVILTPFIDRYVPADQATIIATYKAKGRTHWKLWWPDSRDAGGVGGGGQTEAQFVATCQMLLANGLWPVPFLYSKVYDGPNPSPTKNDSLIAALQAGGVAQAMCVGGELDLFFDPGPVLQATIDHIASLVVPATNLYVHFSPGYVAWQSPGDLGSVFWNNNVGKLTGLLHQKVPDWDCGMYQARLADLLVRFGDGVSGWPTDSGLGHPFDVVADEYSAPARFDGSMSEAAAKVMGNQAICSPSQGGGPPTISIQGFNNGGPIV